MGRNLDFVIVMRTLSSTQEREIMYEGRRSAIDGDVPVM